MRKALVLMMMVTSSVVAVERQELLPLIATAATTTSNAYLKVRAKIVEYDKEALSTLSAIAVDETLPWQQQLVARICYERIERKEKIKELIETDWYMHPKFNPEWNGSLVGPEWKMHELVVPELKVAGLWYYYLEQEWKVTGEEGKIRHNPRFPDAWTSCCILAIKDNPDERIWFLRICADLMAISPTPTRWDNWLFPTLQREEKPDAVFLLEHRMPPPTPEPPFRLGTKVIKIKDE